MNSKPFNLACRLRQDLLILIALTLLAPFASAFNVTLGWNANQEPNVAGYKVYMGSQSGTYDTSIDAGLATRQLISSLEPGHLYNFVVTAYDTDGQESGFSIEVAYTVQLDGTNAFAVPLGITFSGVAPAVSFAGEPGRKYFVQASGDLLSWQTIHEVTALSTGTYQWPDLDAPNFSKRFYRVIGAIE